MTDTIERSGLCGLAHACLASSVKHREIMWSPSDSDVAHETDVYPHARNLSWMASLAVAGGDMRTAEGYLLELLSICVFAERAVDLHSD